LFFAAHRLVVVVTGISAEQVSYLFSGIGSAMELDTSKIDDAVLALLYLGLHDGARAWKGFDWDAMDRLHRAGLISDPRGAAKSVVFTEVGLERAARLLQDLFGNQTGPGTAAAGGA
jgi:hypothetical protein